jgi:Zn-dependent protease with chaperone function
MELDLSDMNQKKPNLAYALGRKAAPLFFKANWIMKSLTGSESEKIAAEFQMGYLLAQVYEEKVPAGENNRLSEIATHLVSSLRNKERKFTFKYDQSGVPNALAIPGGFIYVSEKLIDLCGEDRDAIAFVLAHEIAHTINGDANKRFLTKTVITGLSHVRTRGMNPAVQSVLSHVVQQGYSREQEYRADRFAVALTKAAGADPAGGCRLFSELQKHEKEPNFLGSYFSSHPALSDRIERINRRLEKA